MSLLAPAEIDSLQSGGKKYLEVELFLIQKEKGVGRED